MSTMSWNSNSPIGCCGARIVQPRRKGRAVPDCRPIFVGGLFRSGTSLFRAMLGQHPNIAAGLETYWFDIDWNDLAGENARERFRRLAVYYERDQARIERLALQSPDVGTFLTTLLDDDAYRRGKSRWAEKTPGNIVHAARLFQLWPNATLIHIVRDPRDVLASLRRTKKMDDPDFFADMWCKFLGGAEQAKQAPPWGNGQFMEIRYEQLVADPQTAMRGVIAFIGEKWHPASGNFEGKTDEFNIVLKATGKASATLDSLRRPIDSSRVGGFSYVLTTAELDRVEARIAAAGFGELYRRLIAETPQSVNVTVQ